MDENIDVLDLDYDVVDDDLCDQLGIDNN